MPNQWTPERRAAQSERIKALKPWLKSTGPKTKSGKKRSSRNALKHGGRSAPVRQIRKALRLNREFLKLVAQGLLDLDGALGGAQTNYNKTREKP
jgi:hypothetical protein